MKPVFQDKFGLNNGNCMQAAIASLFEMELLQVPEFRGKGDEYTWWDEYLDFLKSIGYKLDCVLHNPRQLGGYGQDQFTDIINGKIEGINGFFYAAVYSPGLLDRMQFICNPQYSRPTHAVIIDKDFNIVHDPHSHYQGVKQYPLHEWLNYNGVLMVDIIQKIQPDE